jgi:hypothetical protein
MSPHVAAFVTPVNGLGRVPVIECTEVRPGACNLFRVRATLENTNLIET